MEIIAVSGTTDRSESRKGRGDLARLVDERDLDLCTDGGRL